MQSGMPEILLGAEVAFFPGISKAEDLERLSIGDTDAFLLEMPFAPWTDSDLDEVRSLAESRGFSVILAHLERYLEIPENKRRIPKLLEMPVTVQINAGSLLDWRRRGRVVRMFRNGSAHVLGSDCHGMHRRPPDLQEGRAVLGKKLGQGFLDRMDQFGSELLKLL